MEVGNFTLQTPLSETETTGRAVLDAKRGRLDVQGKGNTLPCTCTLKAGRLTLIVWPNAAAWNQGGDTLKAGTFVLEMERPRKKT